MARGLLAMRYQSDPDMGSITGFLLLLLLFSFFLYSVTITMKLVVIYYITITVHGITEIGTGYHFIFCWKVVQHNG